MAGKGKIENLHPPWKPGESGNPAGRPRRLPITDRYAVIAEVRLSKEARDKLRLPPEMKRKIKTYGDLLALGQFQSAIKGKPEPAREITDRLEGKPTQAVDLNANVSVNRLEEMERRWRERNGKK